jgi:hypothetical protein
MLEDLNPVSLKGSLSQGSDSPQRFISLGDHIWRMTKKKRILPPESWFLPPEDRNARRRAQRRMAQQRQSAQGLEPVASAADD